MAKSKTNLFTITRLYDAPVKAVWDAWTDTKQVEKWWGPRGFTLTTHSKDLKPGGHWHYTMHGPDGIDYPNTTKYFEVEKYSRLVYDHGGHEDRPPLFRVTATFKDVKGKTKMEMTMALASPEAVDEIKEFIKKANGNSTWDRLGEYLEKQASGKEKFIINRTFDAPLATMYEMWTNPEHVAKWMPPTGMTMKYLKADIRSGGASFYMMTDGKDLKMYGGANYLEIKSPDRLVYTQHFATEDGAMSRHPMAPLWPEKMLTTVTLAAEGPDQTRVTIEWEPYGNFTKEEVEAFIAAKSGMMQGWGGSFEKLEQYLLK